MHFLRGVRRINIELDGITIFRGEIVCCLPGSDAAPLGDVCSCKRTSKYFWEFQTILFTTNEEILATVADNDNLLQKIEPKQQIRTEDLMRTLQFDTEAEAGRTTEIRRPYTRDIPCLTPSATSVPSTSSNNIFDFEREEEQVTKECDYVSCKDAVELPLPDISDSPQIEAKESSSATRCVIHLEILENWGCSGSVGLCGIQFLGTGSKPISHNCVVRCTPELEGDELSLKK